MYVFSLYTWIRYCWNQNTRIVLKGHGHHFAENLKKIKKIPFLMLTMLNEDISNL